MTDIQEVYTEDTVGRKYHTPTKTKKRIFTNNYDDSPVTMVNLKYPITKEEFKLLSDTLRIEYIKYLHEEYGVTASHIARMLGYEPVYFIKTIIKGLKLGYLFKRGGRMSEASKRRWEKFLTASPKIIGEPAVKPVRSKAEEIRTNTKPMLCQNLNFTMVGELHAADIINGISTMVPEGTECQIYITIERSREVSL